MTNKPEILVLGAGVSGLSCGILLLQAGYRVRIWAKDLPPNTTSNIAAAFWYPYLCNPKDKATEWSGYTLRFLQEHALDDPASGCVIRTITEVFDRHVGEPWWRDAVKAYRRPASDELPADYVDGYQTDVPLMDTTKYMDWLLRWYSKLGGSMEQKTISDLREAYDDHPVVVNCTGLGSRELCHDDKLFPVRGQVVTVRPNGVTDVIADDDGGPNALGYIIPRLDDTVLGGTAQVNNWSLEVDPQDTADILHKAAKLSSAFANVEVITEKVGLRPARDAVRLEAECFGDKTVIHNYGHGGAGFTLSWGCARDVAELVRQATGQ